MERILKDIRYGIRGLLRHRGFTAIALATLAVGIGANTAIFSVVNATLLRPLPFKDSNQLVMLWQTVPQTSQAPTAEPNFLDYREQNQVFEHMAAFNGANLTLTGGPRGPLATPGQSPTNTNGMQRSAIGSPPRASTGVPVQRTVRRNAITSAASCGVM